MATPETTEVTSKIFKGEPFSFSFHYLSENVTRFINALFAKILAKMDRVFLLDMFITIIREVSMNAVKANAKRVYFQGRNLNIEDPSQYEQGIELFKKNIVGQFESIEPDLKKSSYRVVFTIRMSSDYLAISIVNNAAIHPRELDRIKMRMDKARQYEDFTDAYDEIYDDSEGAGLGIVLTTLLLKNSGIGADNYRIETDGVSTTTSLLVPEELRPKEVTSKIKEQILNEVAGIPTFPEHIMTLQRLCNDPEASIAVISEKIMLDPALTTDVLKLSNSAGFVPGKRIETISDAVKTIGLKNLNALLLTSGARSILDKRYSRFEQIWEHCNHTAFYARQLAMRYRLGKIVENTFLAGLLHDLGKIIMLSTNQKLTNWVSDVVRDHKIRTSTVMEEISIGISHSALGGLIAEKWEFPEYLCETIRHHHSPLNAADNHRDMVFVTYVANMMCGIESRKYSFSYLEQEVLERFNLTDENEFNRIHTDFKNAYKENRV
ncbi:MAG TPA: HDOD domain-containing protein [Spirochaetes bacterium]|nr:HDOD domain-containing protein [Spirochaetota bacterium]